MRGRSRYSLYSIMANSSFGDLTITNSEYKIIIPKEFITRSGYIYQKIQKIIDNKEYDRLKEYNVKVFKV